MSSTHDRLAELIRSAGSVVALTGAGVSVPSGIPDFRSPGTGLWANVDPMEVAHISVWRREPERFWSFYGPRFALLDGKRPNGAHTALAELGIPVITQNIDGLHAAAGSSDVIEIHGSVASSSCQVDGMRYELAETRARLEADADGVPRCDCGAPLKPDVILFGEMLDETAMMRASRARHRSRPHALRRLVAGGLPGGRAARADARRPAAGSRSSPGARRRSTGSPPCGWTATWRRSSTAVMAAL